MLWRHHPEPTICLDGDRAGEQAANRILERALPLLKPGRTFRFVLIEGGKDPDEVLREQGALVLKAQLANTTPFAEALFNFHRGDDPLDTPERKTALKVKLRKVAASIADPDLAGAYREDLLARFEALWPSRSPVYQAGAAGQPGGGRRDFAGGNWEARRKATAAALGASAQVKDATDRLRKAPRPLAAALAMAAVRDPGVIDDSIERVGSHGFGDVQLDRLAQELVSLRYEADSLEMDAAVRRLQSRGFSPEDFAKLERDAQRAGASAPFLTETGERARELWRQAFDLLMQLESLERAVEGAAQDLSRDQDAATLMTLKGERDQLRRLLNSDWAHPEEVESALPH